MTKELLHRLYERGVTLRLMDDRLEVHAPAGSLTDDLREQLRRQRDDLIDMLRRTRTEELPEPLVPDHDPGRRHDPFPLTDIQHAYWVGRSSVVELGGVSSHFYFELERGGLDPARLEESLNRVIARHDMLRAVIGPDGRQRILPEVPPYRIALADVRGLTGADRDAAIAATRADLDHQVRPADRWPLFEIRATLFDGGRLRLHVSLDVLILDAFSLYLFFQDWQRYYTDPDWSPAPLSLSYRDHVMAEVARIGDARYRRAEQYWLERLDDLPPGPALPLAMRPTDVSRSQFFRRRSGMPAQPWARFKLLAQERGLTPSIALLAAFADTLRRWTAQPAFTLNLTLFNRPPAHPEIGSLIGDFTSVTLLACEPGGESFTARAQALQRRFSADLEHLAYSGVRVLRERGRRLGGGPVAAMPVVFTSAVGLTAGDDDPASGMRFFGDFGYGISQTPQVWLDHQALEEQGELFYNWDAVEELFPAGLLDDVFAAYQSVLGRLATDKDTWDVAGPLVEPPAEQLAERERVNDTAADIPARTLCGLVEDAARRDPFATAVQLDDGFVTYRELLSRARRMARCLRDAGAEPDALVGVVMDRGDDQIAAVLAVTLAGAAYLPIDPQWPPARRRHLLDRGRARLAVTDPRLRDESEWPASVRLLTFDDLAVRDADDGPLEGGPTPENLAYTIFTSGSTGEPKGVMIDHRSAANTIQDVNARFDVDSSDRVFALSALSFDLSVYDIFGVLAAGGTVVVPAPGSATDPAAWSDLVARHGVTIWNSVPALMRAWLDAHPRTGLPPGLRLRLVLLSGDWIPVDMPDAIRDRYPAAQVLSLGGATEASIWSVLYPIGAIDPAWTSIPYGRPMANQTMYVYDSQLRPAATWSTGEIYIGGIGVARGYWDDLERTAERFVIHPDTRERLYRTGDLGRYLPGGDIEFLGREDFQVKINGYRIELGEITTALRRRPGVADAAVAVATNPHTGARTLVGYVVPADCPEEGATPQPADTAAAVEAGYAELADGMARHADRLVDYRDTWRATEAASPTVMARTLARLGHFAAPSDTATAAEVVAAGGLLPRFTGLVDRWLSTLARYGLLEPTAEADRYRCADGFDAELLDDDVRWALEGLDPGDDAGRAMVDYFVACAEQQERLLRGEVSPLQLLLPDGAGTVTDALYAGNPVAQVQNRVAARVVRAVVDRLGGERPARILEVGAGTGATSRQVLAELPEGAVRYHYTDVSAYFLHRARQTFGGRSDVTYDTFDVDLPPTGQGHASGSLDVVIAANVLHDARDLDRTLARLRGVLAPGGVLVLVEATVNTPQQLLTIGYIEGFARHDGQRDLPLLTAEEWQRRLRAAGFARAAAIPGDGSESELLDQQVIVAEAARRAPTVDAEELRAGLAEVLPDYLVPHHYVLIDRIPLSGNGKVDLAALPPPWAGEALRERISPRNAAEEHLFGVWRDALGRDDFGVEDNFFELGGDSLHAVTVLSRLREDMGLRENAEEGLQVLFDNPTIAELAKALHGIGEA